ncbi:hypothetical protein EMPS_06787 [Entomortierella parvispora]|uniref:PARP catalytic domain-containing protein n=1 Tax=Entomortierella parvispora TaxID=205924 RepID=A0A9P3HD28_9FUNG|nr:hypothetical protein EMPS_06787 [Entomortierella parvispora]
MSTLSPSRPTVEEVVEEEEEAKESDAHPLSVVLKGGSSIYRLDAADERYQHVSASFLQSWTKPNATDIRIEAIWKVLPNRLLRRRHEAYRQSISTALDPLVLNEKTLFHGTHSCLAQRIFNQRMNVVHDLTLDELFCQQDTCATCGIASAGFDISRSGEGSIQRGLGRIWQRFGHGIYFSKHSSKCHFYSKTGETGLNPDTNRRYSTMVVSNVVLGNAFTAQGSSNDRKWTKAPQGYHSVQGLPGYAGINYEENVVFTKDACLPSEIIVYSFSHTTEY